MNCRGFERQAADWLSGRLSPERAEKMAAHGKACAACARTARTEAQFRERWHEGATPSHIADLWPRLAARLEAPGRGAAPARRADARRPQWAAAVGIVLATMGVCQWGRLPVNRNATGSMTAAHQGDQAPVERGSSEAAALQSHAGAWSALGDVSQPDPAVDDPAGTNMENVWTYLKTDAK